MTDSTVTTQLRRGVIGPCILVLLSGGARYGLQLVRELSENGQLLSSQGTIYPLLNRLTDNGLVSSYWEVGDDDKRRRFYELTAAGRDEITAFTAEWNAFSGAVNALIQSASPQQKESA